MLHLSPFSPVLHRRSGYFIVRREAIYCIESVSIQLASLLSFLPSCSILEDHIVRHDRMPLILLENLVVIMSVRNYSNFPFFENSKERSNLFEIE